MDEIKDYFLIFIGFIGGLNILLDAILKLLKIKESLKDKDKEKK